MSNEYEIVTGKQLEHERRNWVKSSVKLDPARVPNGLIHLIPMAERWGVTDDVAREKLLSSTTKADLEKIANELSNVEALLDRWLSGPEANSVRTSPEYVAFSALRLLVI